MTELILGNMNYSSWSIRAALVARHSGLDINENIVPLGFDETRQTLIRETGFHTVPVLRDGALFIRDSLAITEWIAERSDAGRVWPLDPEKRSLARSIVSEMHSGFMQIRSQMAVDVRSCKASPKIEGALASDIDRVLTIWQNYREKYRNDGPFLFGDWCAADAFYAPVVTRFKTYGFELHGSAEAYSDAVWESNLLKQLRNQADAEPWEIELGDSGPIRAWIRD